MADGELLMGSSDFLSGSAFNQVRGLDMLPRELPRVLRFAAAARHPVWLHARHAPWPGAIPESEQVLHATTPDGVARVKLAGDILLREAGPDEAGTWVDILISASGIDEPEATAWRAMAPDLTRHGSIRWIAELDGEPVGTALLRVRRGTGLLRGAAVLPHARGRGLHQALLAIRAGRAAELGAQVVVATAAPGSASERNMVRSGLRPVARVGAYRAPSSRP